MSKNMTVTDVMSLSVFWMCFCGKAPLNDRQPNFHVCFAKNSPKASCKSQLGDAVNFSAPVNTLWPGGNGPQRARLVPAKHGSLSVV